ncbi:MAG: histidinol-phosphate transaminase [Clostridia bacterium]|nr:histidinol-phosphate transaminase [Clostridia bacterium]
MSRFLAEQYQPLVAYTPGEQPTNMKYIKLNTNESPFPPSPEVVRAIGNESVRELRLYSDPTAGKLRKKIAEQYGVKASNVFVSNGSDEILNFSFMAFCRHGVAFPSISYGFYSVYADLYGIDSKKIDLTDDFRVDYRDYLNVGRAVVIANPNAPTGIAISVDKIEEIVKSNPDHVVLIDEAYVDFGAESALPLIEKYDNLLVVRTFSKSYSLAGARLGFAFGNSELIADLEKIKYSTNPYNVNRLSLLAGAAAMDEKDYYMQNCRKIQENRAYTTKALEDLGFFVLPSSTNFIFAKSEKIGGEALYLELKARGILVRHFTAELIKDYNRITIGTMEEMQTLVATVKEILTEQKRG